MLVNVCERTSECISYARLCVSKKQGRFCYCCCFDSSCCSALALPVLKPALHFSERTHGMSNIAFALESSLVSLSIANRTTSYLYCHTSFIFSLSLSLSRTNTAILANICSSHTKPNKKKTAGNIYNASDN